MNTKGLLDQLMKSGDQLLGQVKDQKTSTKGQGSGLSGLMSGFGGGAVTGGALGLLLGSKKGRKMGGKVLTYGGLAALGVVAYKAYSAYQQKQNNPAAEPQTIDRLPDAQAEQHSLAILRALIGAAKSDGHIDERERQLINEEMAKLDNQQDTRQWLQLELAKPLDPAEIASAASTPEIAAEMYLASLLVVDEQNYMERTYLQELARQMRLDPALQQELYAQAGEALRSAR
ncbi:tellurite resistance TerB family protein [Lacimicrobium alkaliphilum]|uniref:Protein YebE n=1 Tax=Lacimicrobium alkaliphilum TaxID=1526571 RepID=A0ABQ1RAE2_9ALTE|nr:tellurite resistance TerB family protein [Lacimicrobium alkaliphilum]GGD63872.1 protein YebE [Lacimicrobium alkaliphilum]